MTSQRENYVKSNDDRSSSQSEQGRQQSQSPNRSQYDSKADPAKQGTTTDRANFDKQDTRDNDGKKDIDAKRHPEEQVALPKENAADNKRPTAQPGRV